jgi:hypothetical protein
MVTEGQNPRGKKARVSPAYLTGMGAIWGTFPIYPLKAKRRS